jgi:hypothetical protein
LRRYPQEPHRQIEFHERPDVVARAKPIEYLDIETMGGNIIVSNGGET